MLFKTLPFPDSVAQQHSEHLKLRILEEIAREGPLTFARYMNLVLYTPGLGYYSAGAHKFGAAGDFITAPEISPLFSQCIARQCHQVLHDLSGGNILELGAGTGIMAVNILKELKRNRSLPDCYFILEVSADLRDRQKKTIQENIPELFHYVRWLNHLPTNFVGIILANEVIDALPVHKFKIENNVIKEILVDSEREVFVWKIDSPSSLEVTHQIENLGINFPDNYESEINLLLAPWIASLADILKKGLILLIDYGFPRHEYYHPNRSQGTVACHYQHYSHFDPLILPGIQDVSAHVDFTAVAEAAARHRLGVSGFINQAGFLLNCGLISCTTFPKSELEHYKMTQQIKKLTLPSEMGELFKVIALTRNYDSDLLGFLSGNQVGRLSL